MPGGHFSSEYPITPSIDALLPFTIVITPSEGPDFAVDISFPQNNVVPNEVVYTDVQFPECVDEMSTTSQLVTVPMQADTTSGPRSQNFSPELTDSTLSVSAGQTMEEQAVFFNSTVGLEESTPPMATQRSTTESETEVAYSTGIKHKDSSRREVTEEESLTIFIGAIIAFGVVLTVIDLSSQGKLRCDRRTRSSHETVA
ncbi:uncharacterized protein [Ptychodera flava]|uniref:uncharacterized protein n=1 Tax=Ptychodera flava TaxID=63121 RepID=UPI003969D9D6